MVTTASAQGLQVELGGLHHHGLSQFTASKRIKAFIKNSCISSKLLGVLLFMAHMTPVAAAEGGSEFMNNLLAD